MSLRHHAVVLGAFVAMLTPAGHVFGQASDPVVGTWRLDVAKSKFSPGPALKSETRTYVASGSEIKASSKTVDAAGKATTAKWTVVYDGKDRPETGIDGVDSLSLKRVDPFTTTFIEKKAGKTVITGTRAVSKDGKVMTISSKGTDAQGKPMNNVLVYTKQ
jgi:hypothetical protein